MCLLPQDTVLFLPYLSEMTFQQIQGEFAWAAFPGGRFRATRKHIKHTNFPHIYLFPPTGLRIITVRFWRPFRPPSRIFGGEILTEFGIFPEVLPQKAPGNSQKYDKLGFPDKEAPNL